MKKLTAPNTNTLADWAYLAIDKHFHKIVKYENEVPKDKDPEAVHQMRVGTRRLRSAMSGFAPVLDLPNNTKEKKIANLAHSLGTLRDFDVLKAALEKYQETLPKKEQKCLAAVFEHLAKQRKQAFTEVKSTLKAKNYQNLKQSWQKWLKEPTYQPLAQLPIGEILPDLLLPLISELFLDPGWLVGISVKSGQIELVPENNLGTVEQLLAEQGVILHNLRKEIKRVRYQMELFCDFYGSEYRDYFQDLKLIQETLGKIQDSAILAQFLEDVLESDIQEQMPTLSFELEQNRYQAWQEWQPLQQKYLNHQTRLNLHLAILKPVVG